MILAAEVMQMSVRKQRQEQGAFSHCLLLFIRLGLPNGHSLSLKMDLIYSFLLLFLYLFPFERIFTKLLDLKYSQNFLVMVK